MRALIAIVALVAGCGVDRGAPPVDPAKPTAAATAPTAATPSSGTALGAPSGSTATGAPLFSYEEDTTTIAFWPSGKVRITLAAKGAERACDSELGDGGNMWTRADVDAAFRAADVQSALKQNGWYRSSYPEAHLVADGGTIHWVIVWTEMPPPEPPAVHHLQEVLHVVLTNRAALCR